MRSAISTALLFLSLTTACAANRSDSTDARQSSIRARIENGSSLDMDLYVRRQTGSTSRLGFVPANQTASFDLPPGLLAGAVTIVFEAHPVRRSGQAVVSEPFGVSGADELVWSIPPQ
jgi:hypothetical protein